MPINDIEQYCLIFINNIFQEDSKPEKIIDLLQKEFSLRNINKDHLTPEKLNLIATSIFNSLMQIYEFADRGMKGFLTGDISYNLIKSCKEIIEIYIKEIEILENNFVKLNLDPNDFYNSFFKIDNNFYLNNSSKNLCFNYEIESSNAITQTNNSVYVVNLKSTQFFDRVQKQIKLKNIDNDNKNVLKFEDIKNIIDKEKHRFHNIFNDMYNAIFEQTVTKKLKTPLNGIKFPHKENKDNLFRRQLILEDHAYDSSLRKFKESFLKLTE